MTDDPNRPQDDPINRQDDRLAEELESLYRRVASLDSTEAVSDMTENPDLYYKILQIHRDVSPADIHVAYKKMNSAWDPERYPHVPSWKETSREKLKEIKNAYEKLLLLHGVRETAGAGKLPHPSLSTVPLPFPENPDPEETAPVRANVNIFSGSAFKLHLWLLASGALITFILLMVFFWPTLYHYEAVHLEGKDYPLRINRLTTHTQYYDGRQWLEPPLRVETQHRVLSGTAPLPMTAPSAAAGIRSEPKPASSPSAQDITPQAAPASSAARPDPTGIRSESKPVSPAPAKQKITPPGQNIVQIKIGAPYSIQVGAYPLKNKAEALAVGMRAKKFAVRVEAVSVQGKGQWYRVLLGQFENRDAALRYLKDHRIGETYPGSFIQRAVIQSK